jgi:hypothetical protein
MDYTKNLFKQVAMWNGFSITRFLSILLLVISSAGENERCFKAFIK